MIHTVIVVLLDDIPACTQNLKDITLSITTEEKTKAENALRSSNLKYTIIRPGQLTNDTATGNAILTEDCILGTMTRQDLASMVMKAIDDDETIGKIYSTLDQHKDPDFSWVQNR